MDDFLNLLLNQIAEHGEGSHFKEHMFGSLAAAVPTSLAMWRVVAGKLAQLDLLKRREERLRLRVMLMKRRIEELTGVVNRTGRNAHQQANIITSLIHALHEVGEKSGVEVELPPLPLWEPAQMEAKLELSLSEDDDEESGENER